MLFLQENVLCSPQTPRSTRSVLAFSHLLSPASPLHSQNVSEFVWFFPAVNSHAYWSWGSSQCHVCLLRPQSRGRNGSQGPPPAPTATTHPSTLLSFAPLCSLPSSADLAPHPDLSDSNPSLLISPHQHPAPDDPRIFIPYWLFPLLPCKLSLRARCAKEKLHMVLVLLTLSPTQPLTFLLLFCNLQALRASPSLCPQICHSLGPIPSNYQMHSLPSLS